MILNGQQISRCLRTVSPQALYMVAEDAIARRKPLSVVRMGDGEVALMKQVRSGNPADLAHPPENCKVDWLQMLGVDGIRLGMLGRRLTQAATECTYFAPSLTGIYDEKFDVYQFFPNDVYVDNFFVNAWTEEMKEKLFRAAGHVLFIHRNEHTADSIQLRVQANLGVKVSFIKLDNWRGTDDVIAQAALNTAPLVLFSAGPAGKYIGPTIARQGKVALDVGNSADQWTMKHLPVDREKAEAFHAEWSAKQ
jgi:hypothetical protein